MSADHESRVHVRREADERFVAAIRVGDTESFGRLYDGWVDIVHDRIVRAGIDEGRASELEQAIFEASWRDASSGGGASTFGATVVRHAIREANDDQSVVRDSTGAHTRVVRATNLGTVAADPGVATMLFEAADALGAASSTIFDLRVRHGLTFEEVGEAIHRDPAEVERLAERLPDAFDAVVRARVIWGDGLPGMWGGSEDEVAPVRAALESAGVDRFGPDAVRVLNKLVREDDRLRARAMIALGASAVFAAIPLASASTEHKRALAASLADRGVPVGRSEFASRVRRPSAAAASAAAAAVARERDEAAAAAARKGIPTTDDPSAAPLVAKAGRGEVAKDRDLSENPVKPDGKAAGGGAAAVAGAAVAAADPDVSVKRAKGGASRGDELSEEGGAYGRKAGTAAAGASGRFARDAPRDVTRPVALTGVTPGGVGDDPGETSRSGRKPLLVGAGVMVAILLIGGIAMALSGSAGDGGDDVALESEPRVTTPSTTLRPTSTVARTTPTTEEPADGPDETIVAPDPVTPPTRPAPVLPEDPQVVPPPVVTTQTTLPAGQVPTTVPREQVDVDLKVLDWTRTYSKSMKVPYTRTEAPIVTWTLKGNPANVVIEIQRGGQVLEEIDKGQSAEYRPCPGGWSDFGQTCNAEPGTYDFVASYTLNGIRIEARRIGITFVG